jgi:histidyl-tRNA synthetase
MALVEHFREAEDALSEDSRERLHKNPLRILDSKDPRDRAFVGDAPKIDDFLSGEAQDYFGKVCEGLGAAGVAWERNPALVRGLDYYRHTAFEFVTDRLGAQGTVLGGGRYDGLIETLGGPHTPAVGWAAGIERLAMLVGDISETAPSVVVVLENDRARSLAYRALSALRRDGIDAEIVATGAPRKRFDKARKLNGRLLVVADMHDDRPVLSVRKSLNEALEARVRGLVDPIHG